MPKPDSFEGIGTWTNSAETQQSSQTTPQSLDQRSKMKEALSKTARGEAQMRGNPEECELNSAADVCRRCKKNFPSVLSCIGKKTKEGCYRDSEVGTVHSGRGVKGPFHLKSLSFLVSIAGTKAWIWTEKILCCLLHILCQTKLSRGQLMLYRFFPTFWFENLPCFRNINSSSSSVRQLICIR